MLDWGDDGSGLFMKYLRRGSGYYIDVGASELVANGSVKLKSGVSLPLQVGMSITANVKLRKVTYLQLLLSDFKDKAKSLQQI